MNKSDIRSTVMCDGLRARIKREVFAAAVTPRSPERDASLDYWHARQRNMDRIYYRHRLYENRHPTRAERAYSRELAAAGSWIGSSEQLAEARQMGLTAL
ncbi:hypothetical protein V2V90_23835 (plasmid) [Agrobacterium leguminum]|uniref:hypothetical protein n=1 Tax=Agrobacterium leguminum TaxID=2792015 RepID=UPI0030D4C49E